MPINISPMKKRIQSRLNCLINKDYSLEQTTDSILKDMIEGRRFNIFSFKRFGTFLYMTNT